MRTGGLRTRDLRNEERRRRVGGDVEGMCDGVCEGDGRGGRREREVCCGRRDGLSYVPSTSHLGQDQICFVKRFGTK